jgi:hypothetical protein
MFTLALEWQEGWPPAQVEADGRFLQSENPWERLVSVHGLTGDFAFPEASWVDYLDLQAGNSADPARVHALGIANRAKAVKPLIQEELGMGEEDAANRRKAWAAFLAGAAGVGTGADLAQLARFASRVPFWKMAPADNLILSRNAYALAAPGKAYVVQVWDGGTIRVDLRSGSGPFTVEWFDPRNGSSRAAPSVQGGRVRTLNAPTPEDWILYIYK